MHAYERIAQTLASEIEAGTWPAGDLLPQLPELEKRFSVSRITVRGAIEQLAKQGLVYTGYAKGRRGTIVRPRGRTDIVANLALRPGRPSKDRIDAFSEAAARAGRRAGKRFRRDIEVPPATISERLGISASEPVVVRTVTQLLDEEPWSIEIGYYPMDLAQEVGLDVPSDIAQGTIRALADAGYTEIAHIDEITDEAADAEEAHNLAVPVGSPLLVQIRTAATSERVTRVMRYLRLGGRNRLIWHLGDQEGLNVIERARREANQ